MVRSSSLLLATVYAALVVFRVLPRHDIVVLPVVLGGIVFAIDRATRDADLHARRGARLRFALLFGSTAILLAGAIGQLWSMGYEGRSSVVAGIVPWSDSGGYTSDALRLVHGVHFSNYATRRPLFSLVLSCLLRLTDESFRVTVVLLSLAGALAVTAATTALWRTHGPKAAVLLYAILVLFERRWAGFFQTEHVGFPLGVLAFVLAWWALDLPRSSPRRAWFLAGSLLALGLALFARPGPFFVLPAILGWSWWTAKDRKRTLLLGVSAIALAYVVNTSVVRGLGSGDAFGDYPTILYGLVHDEEYDAMCGDHPEVCSLPEDQFVPAAYRLIGSYLLEHPVRAITGPGSSLAAYFVSPYGLFSFVFYDPDDHVLEDGAFVRKMIAERGYLAPVAHWVHALGVFSLVNLVVMALLGAAFVAVCAGALVRGVLALRRKTLDEHTRFLLAANVGVVLSTPMLPPWTTPILQTACTTMPLVVAFGAVIFLGRRSTEAREPAAGTEWLAPRLLGAAATGVALLLYFPAATPERATRPECTAPGAAYLDVLPGTKVKLVDGEGERPVFGSKLRASDFAANLDFLRRHNMELVSSIEPLDRAGTVLAYAYDVCSQSAKLVLDDTGTLGSSAGYTSFHVAKTASPDVFHVVASAPAP